MRTVFFLTITCFMFFVIVEKANSKPPGSPQQKKGEVPSPTKPKSPAKANPKSPGKAKPTKGAETGAEKAKHSLPSKTSQHTDPHKMAKSPAKKDKVPKSQDKSPKSNNKSKIIEKAEAKSPTETEQMAKNRAKEGAKETVEAQHQQQQKEPKLTPNAKATENMASESAIKLPAEGQQPPSSAAAFGPSSADEFGPFEPSIVAFSEPFDDDVDTSGSDFDLDFTESEGFSDDGQYFDFGDEWADEGQFEGTDFLENAPELMVH